MMNAFCALLEASDPVQWVEVYPEEHGPANSRL